MYLTMFKYWTGSEEFHQQLNFFLRDIRKHRVTKDVQHDINNNLPLSQAMVDLRC